MDDEEPLGGNDQVSGTRQLAAQQATPFARGAAGKVVERALIGYQRGKEVGHQTGQGDALLDRHVGGWGQSQEMEEMEGVFGVDPAEDPQEMAYTACDVPPRSEWDGDGQPTRPQADAGLELMPVVVEDTLAYPRQEEGGHTGFPCTRCAPPLLFGADVGIDDPFAGQYHRLAFGILLAVRKSVVKP